MQLQAANQSHLIAESQAKSGKVTGICLGRSRYSRPPWHGQDQKKQSRDELEDNPGMPPSRCIASRRMDSSGKAMLNVGTTYRILTHSRQVSQ